MKIADRALVSIDYTLTLDSGEVVDRSVPGEPLDFVFGMGQVVPGLERQVGGLEPGAEVAFVVEPAEGYGLSNPGLKRELPRDRFPDGLALAAGMVFQAEGTGGRMVFRVDSVTDELVVADFNHPLAGERLHFEIRVAGVRTATNEEVAAAGHGCGCSHNQSHECGGCQGSC